MMSVEGVALFGATNSKMILCCASGKKKRSVSGKRRRSGSG